MILFLCQGARSYQKLSTFYAKKIKQIIDTLPGKSKINILSISDTLSLYSGLKEDFSFDYLMGRMKNIKNDYSKLTSYVKNIPSTYNKELHIITDYQSSSFNNMTSNPLEDWEVFIHDANLIDNNLAIIDITINEEFITINNEIEITVILQNNGTETAKNALIIFTIDNINIGQHQVDMSPNELKEEKFRTILNSPGNHTCSFEIIYDDFQADNIYYFPLNIKENINLSLLSANQNNQIFIENSLKALSESYPNLIINNLLDIRNNENILVESDVSFVFGYNLISRNNLEESVIDNLNSGGYIYIFPDQDEIFQKNDFFEFALFDQSDMKFTEYDSESYYLIKNNDILDANIKEILNNDNKNSELFKLYKHFQFNTNQSPYILVDGRSIWNVMNVGNGKLNIIGFTPTLEWTDFPLKANFIALVDELINSSGYIENKTLEVGDFYTTTENDISIDTPDKRTYTFTNFNKSFFFNNPGLYELRRRDGSQVLSVNPSKEELFYNRISNEDIKNHYNNIYFIDNQGDLEEYIKESRVGIELWKYFLYISILLIIIEMVISNQLFRRI